jgi:hypothetical protein
MTAPAGWTAVPNGDWTDGNNARIHAWYRVAGSSEPSSYTFTLTGGSGQDISGGMLAIANASTTAPINASNGQSNGPAQSKNATAPSITTTVPNTLLVFGAGCNVGSLSFTPPTGMTEHWDRSSTSSSGRVVSTAASQLLTSAGPTGTRVATASSSCASVVDAIAIAPAS